jgi:hypothetical protein
MLGSGLLRRKLTFEPFPWSKIPDLDLLNVPAKRGVDGVISSK